MTNYSHIFPKVTLAETCVVNCFETFETLEDYNHHLVKACSEWIETEKTRTSMNSVYNKCQ